MLGEMMQAGRQVSRLLAGGQAGKQQDSLWPDSFAPFAPQGVILTSRLACRTTHLACCTHHAKQAPF